MPRRCPAHAAARYDLLTDALLAIFHFLLAFALVIVLTMEIMLTRRDIDAPRMIYLSRLDMRTARSPQRF